MKPILLTGCDGQVGAELRGPLAALGPVVACNRGALDLADSRAIRDTVRRLQPAVIVNAAAYTAVDRAEEETELAEAINGVAPGILAEEAARVGALLVHYSTDYVFDGEKAEAYVEDDATAPLNAYGRSKLAGERAVQAAGADHLIFRTSWVYGMRGRNFLLTILRLAREREELRIVDDQFGAPTWSRDIAYATAAVLSSLRGIGPATALHDRAACSGLYHLSAGGRTTWCGFAHALIDAAPPEVPRPRVVPISTADYPTPARRPRNSTLSNARLSETFGIALPPWEVSLRDCMR